MCVKIKFILSVSFYTIHRAVRFQLNHLSFDECENICTSFYYHQQVACMNQQSLLRDWSWNYSMLCILCSYAAWLVIKLPKLRTSFDESIPCSWASLQLWILGCLPVISLLSSTLFKLRGLTFAILIWEARADAPLVWSYICFPGITFTNMVMAWMSNDIPLLHVDMIHYPWPKLVQQSSESVKGTMGSSVQSVTLNIRILITCTVHPFYT